jgi:hypothetical protein
MYSVSTLIIVFLFLSVLTESRKKEDISRASVSEEQLTQILNKHLKMKSRFSISQLITFVFFTKQAYYIYIHFSS